MAKNGFISVFGLHIKEVMYLDPGALGYLIKQRVFDALRDKKVNEETIDIHVEIKGEMEDEKDN